MKDYKDAAIKTIKKIIHKFRNKNNSKKDFKFSLTMYRDHGEEGFWGFMYVTKEKDFTNDKEILKFIEEYMTFGGGNDSEAVLDGLDESLKLNWRDISLKFLFLIADAPPHGQKYVVEGCEKDSKPDGCPKGLNIGDLSEVINKKKIKFKLIRFRKRTEKMEKIFNDEILDFEAKTLENVLDLPEIICDIIQKEIKEIDLNISE